MNTLELKKELKEKSNRSYRRKTMNTKTLLVDGNKYFLGAAWGTYRAESDKFDLGNCSVHRSETIFADKFEKTEAERYFEDKQPYKERI